MTHFLWVQVYFLVNGKYILVENKELLKTLDNHFRLLDILKREISNGYHYAHKYKEKYTECEMLSFKKEAFTTEILIKCLDFMLINELNVAQFCNKMNINCTKFAIRMNNTDVEFTNIELEKLDLNNIIHIK